MRDIQNEIQENLDAIEKTYQVKILLAVESGSRAWGFASPDSDYDVRFIYVHRPEEYLRVDTLKDVIEWQLDEVLDINGWDIRKVLLAFGKGNPNVMEWANSPIIYRKASEWDALRAAAMGYFSEKSAQLQGSKRKHNGFGIFFRVFFPRALRAEMHCFLFC